MLCVSSVKGSKVWGHTKIHFYSVFLLLLLTSVHSVSLCGLCNVFFNIFKCFLYKLMFLSVIWV